MRTGTREGQDETRTGKTGEELGQKRREKEELVKNREAGTG